MGPLGIIWGGEILSYSSKIFVDSLHLCLPFTLYYFQRTKAKWTQENNNICNKYKSLHRKVHCLDHLSIFYLVCCKWNRETIKCSKPYYFMSNYICDVVEPFYYARLRNFVINFVTIFVSHNRVGYSRFAYKRLLSWTLWLLRVLNMHTPETHYRLFALYIKRACNSLEEILFYSSFVQPHLVNLPAVSPHSWHL